MKKRTNVKFCESCEQACPSARSRCPFCGAEFPRRDVGWTPASAAKLVRQFHEDVAEAQKRNRTFDGETLHDKAHLFLKNLKEVTQCDLLLLR